MPGIRARSPCSTSDNRGPRSTSGRRRCSPCSPHLRTAPPGPIHAQPIGEQSRCGAGDKSWCNRERPAQRCRSIRSRERRTPRSRRDPARGREQWWRTGPYVRQDRSPGLCFSAAGEGRRRCGTLRPEGTKRQRGRRRERSRERAQAERTRQESVGRIEKDEGKINKRRKILKRIKRIKKKKKKGIKKERKKKEKIGKRKKTEERGDGVVEWLNKIYGS